MAKTIVEKTRNEVGGLTVLISKLSTKQECNEGCMEGAQGQINTSVKSN